MGRWMPRFLAGAFLAALMGCTLNNAASDTSVAGKTDSGVIVMALGRTGAIEFTLTAKVRSLTTGRTYLVAVDDDVAEMDFGHVTHMPNSPNGSEWGWVPVSEPLERLVVATLPAGEYEIVYVSGRSPRFKRYGATRFTVTSEEMGVRFAVQAGQVSYLGSIVFSFPDWLAYSHYYGPMRVLISDTRQRDQSLVHQRYPNLPATLPDRAIVQAPDPQHVFKYYLNLQYDGDGASQM